MLLLLLSLLLLLLLQLMTPKSRAQIKGKFRLTSSLNNLNYFSHVFERERSKNFAIFGKLLS